MGGSFFMGKLTIQLQKRIKDELEQRLLDEVIGKAVRECIDAPDTRNLVQHEVTVWKEVVKKELGKILKP